MPNLNTRILFDEDAYQSTFKARVLAISELGIALDQTLFYPAGGGQPGDQGHLLLPNGTMLPVLGTQRDPQSWPIVWHSLNKSDYTKIQIYMDVQGYLDWELRYQHMRMHTCLHLLSALIDAPVTGCNITAEKGRLDFDLPDLTFDKSYITEQLNEIIRSALEVRTLELPFSEIKNGVEFSRMRIPKLRMHEAIRIIEISGVDSQPCGGTHVKNTSEIGGVVCEKIEKKSRLNRRITIRFT